MTILFKNLHVGQKFVCFHPDYVFVKTTQVKHNGLLYNALSFRKDGVSSIAYFREEDSVDELVNKKIFGALKNDEIFYFNDEKYVKHYYSDGDFIMNSINLTRGVIGLLFDCNDIVIVKE